MQERVERAGPLTGSALQWVAVGSVTALIAIHHTGVVYQDVKPANLILGPDGLRVVDLGVPG